MIALSKYDNNKFFFTFCYRLNGRLKTINIAVAIVRRAIQKRHHEPSNIQIQYLKWGKYIKSDRNRGFNRGKSISAIAIWTIRAKFSMHFGCTNIIFANKTKMCSSVTRPCSKITVGKNTIGGPKCEIVLVTQIVILVFFLLH